MNVSKRLSFALLSIFMLTFLTFGCVHKKVPQGKGGVSYSNPFITLNNSDFNATQLSGENEIPPNPDLNASGKLFLKVNEDSTKIYFTLYVDSLKNIIGATINYGTKDYNGPSIVTLYPARHTSADSLIGRTLSGMLNSGDLTKPYLETGALEKGEISDLIRVIENDSAYVQIQTRYMHDGAIRAQIKSSQLTGTGK